MPEGVYRLVTSGIGGSGRRDLDRDRRAGPVYETARSGLVGL